MKKSIKCLLLSAGLGTRLRPLTLEIPKCLVEINNKPLLEHWLDKLEMINVDNVLINTHYLSEKVDKFLDSQQNRSIKINKFYEQKLYGTAGTLIKNYNFFLNSICIMIHSDNFTNMNLLDLLNAHQERPSNCLITMLTFKTNDPKSCGIVETDKRGIVQYFHEKVSDPPGDIANGAIYVFEDDFLNWLIKNHQNAKDFSKEVIPYLLGNIYTFHTDMHYIDIGTNKKLKEARLISQKQD